MSRVLPILFNTDMVRAILDGRKTVTRRIVNIDIANQFDVEHDGKTVVAYMEQETGDSYDPTEICKYQPGDILYVRETWAQVKDIPQWDRYYRDGLPIRPDEYVYKADNVKVDGILPEIKWHSSIHMPKKAARIWLKVTDVRVERLRDITEQQAESEGLYKGWRWSKTSSFANTARQAFMWIWDGTVKKKQFSLYGWAANPWVWVIEFERCESPAN